jgi:hypothetical protein
VVVHNISVTLNAIQVDVEGCISETEVAKFMEALFAVDELRELVRLRNAFVAERAVQILERSKRNSRYIHVKIRRLQNLNTTISVFKLMGQKRLRSNEENCCCKLTFSSASLSKSFLQARQVGLALPLKNPGFLICIVAHCRTQVVQTWLQHSSSSLHSQHIMQSAMMLLLLFYFNAEVICRCSKDLIRIIQKKNSIKSCYSFNCCN